MNGIVVAVQPYFDQNVFLDYAGPDAPAAYHWSTNFCDRFDVLTPQQIQNGSPLVLVADEGNPEDVMPMIEGFKLWNYKLIHYSDGTKFFKNSLGAHSLYLIFERTDLEKEPNAL